MRLRVLLADDHALFREALRMTLDCHPDIVVVAEANGGHGVIEEVERSLPNVVCLDQGMPGPSAVETTQQLIAEHPAVKVVVMSAHSDPFTVASMINAGAWAYVHKMDISRHLPAAIRSVSQNRHYFSPELDINDLGELTAFGLNATARSR